ncbi:hypothetical protein HELRODRAFT_162462 [Helobdella robusta]|uniref:Ig-like domain-containing protein n=1 Tax=Helobdella robusta TaxID=6412 RepID=T1ESP6_HELRO|nr:hypothetical protein HELRODRAFT_162462 [Helobdella robusta]ESN98987.1 hypothetical protein HELRODRAFT_162462 [Helobdella robusta]
MHVVIPRKPQNVSFIENPSNKDVALGTVATFTCKPPPGESPLTIEWRKDGQRLKIDRMNVTKSGTLRISDVRKDDGGIYTCLVLGQNGERESQPAQLTVRGRNQ